MFLFNTLDWCYFTAEHQGIQAQIYFIKRKKMLKSIRHVFMRLQFHEAIWYPDAKFQTPN